MSLVTFLKFAGLLMLLCAPYYACSVYFMTKPKLKHTGGNLVELRKLCFIFTVLFGLPFAVMGAGILFSEKNLTALNFVDPLSSNGFVRAFFALIVVVYAVVTNWIFRKGGDRALVKYPGFFPIIQNPTSKSIRWMWLLSMVSGLVGVGLMLAFRPGFLAAMVEIQAL